MPSLTSTLAIVLLAMVASVRASFTNQGTYEYFGNNYTGGKKTYYNPELSGKDLYFQPKVVNGEQEPTSIDVQPHNYITIKIHCTGYPNSDKHTAVPKNPSYTKSSEISCTAVTDTNPGESMYKCKNEADAAKSIRLDHFQCAVYSTKGKGRP